MKSFLIELDDRCARDLERVAPAKKRRRAEFVRLAIRRAIDLAFDRATEEAYRSLPLPSELTSDDLRGWDPNNALAKGTGPRKARRRRGSDNRAA